MAGRARAIPLVALISVVAALVVLRLRERARGGVVPSASTHVASASLDGAPPSFLARATTPEERAMPAAASPSMLHGDARHTHRAAGEGPTHATLRWTTQVGGAVQAQVVASLDAKALYVASLDGALTALDVKDGAVLWRVPLGERAYSTPCVGPDGTIYVGSDAKSFYAITPAGAVAWKLETNGEADTGAAIAQTGEIVFAAGPTVYAARPGGDLAWRFDAKGKVFTSPAIAPDGTVVFGSQDDHVYALTARGALAWSVDLGADVDGAPAIADDGSIVVGTDGGEVVRLRPGGEIVSRAAVGGFVRGTLSIARNGDALAGVYGPTPRVVRVTPSGTVAASFPVPGTGARELGVHGGPVEDASGALFFGAQDDLVRGLGPGGAWAWELSAKGDVDAPITLLPGAGLVAASDDGNVYLFGQ